LTFLVGGVFKIWAFEFMKIQQFKIAIIALHTTQRRKQTNSCKQVSDKFWVILMGYC
jgi:hypothetical protein